MKNTIIMLIVLILLVSCDRQTQFTKEFVWDEDIKELTGGNLHTWLQKAPFNNKLERTGDDVLMFTNARQVFPFKGRYYNAIKELDRYYSDDTIVFYQTEILFQDSFWGDLFLHAALLYDDQEVFLNDSYYEVGNPIFGGAEAVRDIHRSSLYETSVVAKHSDYKTGIYWASANYKDYLLGFYQQGQLVFETVVPFRGDTLATLDKLKEINKRLGLHISEWENTEVIDLQKTKEPKTFWQDPFLGIYPQKFGNIVYLKIKDSPFVKDNKARKGDYYFSDPLKDNDVFFYTTKQQTELNKEDFNIENDKMVRYQYFNNSIFYEEYSENGYVNGLAKIYFMDNEYLEIHFGYPESDREARRYMHDVLKHIKILNNES